MRNNQPKDVQSLIPKAKFSLKVFRLPICSVLMRQGQMTVFNFFFKKYSYLANCWQAYVGHAGVLLYFSVFLVIDIFGVPGY